MVQGVFSYWVWWCAVAEVISWSNLSLHVCSTTSDWNGSWECPKHHGIESVSCIYSIQHNMYLMTWGNNSRPRFQQVAPSPSKPPCSNPGSRWIDPCSIPELMPVCAEAFRFSWWMGHYGSGSAKPQRGLTNNRMFAKIDLGKFDMKAFNAEKGSNKVQPVKKTISKKSGKSSWSGTPQLKETQCQPQLFMWTEEDLFTIYI